MVRQFMQYAPVNAAFWLKATDDEHRNLYIASTQVNDSNLRQRYGEVLAIVNRLRSPYLDPFRVTLINADSPLARAAIEIQIRFPSSIATRLNGTSFGGTSVDDVNIYPVALQAVAP